MFDSFLDDQTDGQRDRMQWVMDECTIVTVNICLCVVNRDKPKLVSVLYISDSGS